MTRVIGRRGLLGLVLALIAGDPAPIVSKAAPLTPVACDEKAPGGRCRTNGQCCSGRCKRKKGKRKGACRCSQLRQRCRVNTDCRGHVDQDLSTPECDQIPGDPTAVCCIHHLGPCMNDADCRGISGISCDMMTHTCQD